MKKNIYLFAAALAIALTGCSDDELTEGRGIPVETGDEIMFGSTLNGDQNVVGRGIETRTIYGERTTSGIPVYWNNNEPYDKVAIFCPQASAPANHLVNYKIVPSKENQSASSQVIKVNPDEAGLQWGEAEEHKFFGIYPASIVQKADEQDQKGKITASLPTTQQPTGWRIKNDPISRRRIFFGEPNMDYAAMFAYTKVNKSDMAKDKTINLKFQNLITVLDISIPGPESGTVTVTNVNVDVIEGTKKAICGDFNIYVQDADINQGHATCIPSGDPNKVYDRISVPCYDNDTKKFITLGPDDVINVKAFIIPDDINSTIVRKFRITVSTLNGSAKRVTINNEKPNTGTDGTNPDRVIVPHKINRILMPPIEGGEPANWMGNLDPNIYLTELSVPGSKFSYLTAENGAKPAYQTKTIADQFKTGIRAFIVQTGYGRTYREKKYKEWWELNYHYSYKLADEQYRMPVFGAKEGTMLENTLDVIAKGLKEAPTECAFLVLTCQGNYIKHKYYYDEGNTLYDEPRDKNNLPGLNWTQEWIDAIEQQLPQLAEKYPIYKDEITANTTLGDVAGKIIIKVNYNDKSQEAYIDKNATVPALFGIWKQPSSEDLAPHSDLYWGTLNPAGSRTIMYWLCQEATNVGNNAEITEENKKKAIPEMFEKNVKAYQQRPQHDVWFMNDVGGVYTSDGSTTRLAEDMNKIAVTALQERKENAATGLVFMNFADRDTDSGALYKSDYIIATIIDNNFKFALRKRAGGSGSN